MIGRAGRRDHQRPAGVLRVAVRERLQPVRPDVAGERAGRRAVPPADRGPEAAAGAEPRDGRAHGAGRRRSCQVARRRDRPGDGAAVQPVPGGDGERDAGAGRQFRAGDRGDGAGRDASSCRRRCGPSGPNSRSCNSRRRTRRRGRSCCRVVLVFLVLAAQYESRGAAAGGDPGGADVPAERRGRGAAGGAGRSTSSRRSGSWCWSGWRARTPS